MSDNAKSSNTIHSDILEKEIRDFIETVKMGLSHKEEIVEKCQIVEKKLEDLNSRLKELNDVKGWWKDMDDDMDVTEAEYLTENYGTKEDINAQFKICEKECDLWLGILHQLNVLLGEYRNFNKTLCFANIRELLRQNHDVKIGQIEKEAGVRLGYMSRLEKEGNTSEPSMEFIVSAAKLLKVSVDTLISTNFNGLTPAEQYIANFFEKLKADTLADKLEWNRELESNLNRIECDMNGDANHLLFSQETFFEECDSDYPEEVTRVVFNSKTYGPNTIIGGDCFNLKLKNGSILFLMDIEKNPHRVTDFTAYAKEAWMHIPNMGNVFLVGTQDSTPIAPMLDSLFETVKERMEHPQLNSNVMYIIDSFMKDDVSDDDDYLPF